MQEATGSNPVSSTKPQDKPCGFFMMYYVYILYSKEKDRYYIGQTENVEKRLNEHRVRKNLGATDWEVKYTESFETRSDAVLRETEIKLKKRRSYLEMLINNHQN